MDESYSDYSDETESTVLSKWEDIPDDENGVATVTGASYRINDDPGSPRGHAYICHDQRFLSVSAHLKDYYLFHLLNCYGDETGIILVRMIEDTQRLNLLLQNLGFSPTPIDNSLPQRTHLAFVKAFHSKKPALLITTHAVANELKIPPVNFMIYYDIPPDRLTYKDQTSERVDLEKGKVFSLVASNEMKLWNRIIRDQGCVPQLPLDKDEVLRFADEVKTAQKLAARDP